MFPSPCGEKVGINGVPLAEQETYLAEFPSPCGEKVGINLLYLWNTPKSRYLFPSPCGEKVGINPPGGVAPIPGTAGGFRPLAGKR